MQGSIRAKENWELEMELEGFDDDDGDDDGDTQVDEIELSEIAEIEKDESAMPTDDKKSIEGLIKSASNEELEKMIKREMEKKERLSGTLQSIDVKVTISDD